jgi:hypothetical protein
MCREIMLDCAASYDSPASGSYFCDVAGLDPTTHRKILIFIPCTHSKRNPRYLFAFRVLDLSIAIMSTGRKNKKGANGKP